MASPTVRPPVQARSRRTLNRILAATRALTSERGRDAVTVQDIVAKAGTSIGSFYARFSGKEELLRYLDESAWSDARERWDQELASGIEPAATLGTRIHTVVGLVSRVADTALDGELGAELERHVKSTVTAALLERRAEIGHPDPEAAVVLGLAAITGALRNRPDGWEEEALTDELARMWLGYLGGGGSGGADRSVDFFDVWA